MRVIAVILLSSFLYSSAVVGQSPGEARAGNGGELGNSSSVNFARPGVFVSERSGSIVTYAYGVEGMRFMKDRIDSILETHGNSKNPDLAVLRSARDRISRQLDSLDSKEPRNSSLQTEESGRACNISYDLSAETVPGHNFWSFLATADAGYQQQPGLLGPPLPGTGTLSTYAEVSNQHGTMTDSDQVTYDLQGFDGYVEADTAEVDRSVYSADCTYGEAISTLSFSACPNEFVGVAETDTWYCD